MVSLGIGYIRKILTMYIWRVAVQEDCRHNKSNRYIRWEPLFDTELQEQFEVILKIAYNRIIISGALYKIESFLWQVYKVA